MRIASMALRDRDRVCALREDDVLIFLKPASTTARQILRDRRVIEPKPVRLLKEIVRGALRFRRHGLTSDSAASTRSPCGAPCRSGHLPIHQQTNAGSTTVVDFHRSTCRARFQVSRSRQEPGTSVPAASRFHSRTRRPSRVTLGRLPRVLRRAAGGWSHNIPTSGKSRADCR